MDAAIIFTAIIVGSIIVGAFLLMSRRGDRTGEDPAELIRLAEEKANAESELESTRADLDAANQQLETARQFEIHNAKLATDLENERSLHKRVTEELNASQNRREELQSQNQKLTAAISGIKAELEAKNTSLQEESSENSELRQQSTELTEHVNTLTAKVSNLNTQLENAEERLVERGELEKLFGDRFKSMSSETLATQQKQFLERATETLKPLSQKVDKLDREWATTSGAFKQQIDSLATETRTLSTALTRPQARGQWGEMQVERALELSGLVKGIHYETQTSDNQGGRTDFIVHMPHRRDIILDSKVSLVALIDAQDTADENERANHFDRHARHMQDHADSLASKEYWSQLPDSADFVVMVVPEFALPPAVERRPEPHRPRLAKQRRHQYPLNPSSPAQNSRHGLARAPTGRRSTRDRTTRTRTTRPSGSLRRTLRRHRHSAKPRRQPLQRRCRIPRIPRPHTSPTLPPTRRPNHQRTPRNTTHRNHHPLHAERDVRRRFTTKRTIVDRLLYSVA